MGQESTEHHKKTNFFSNIYEKGYKKLLIIPFLLLILAVGQISYQIITTGDFVNKGVSLKGGVIVTVNKPVDVAALEQALKSSQYDISVKKLVRNGEYAGVIIESDIIDKPVINDFIAKVADTYQLEEEDYSVEQMGPSLGASFFRETLIAVIVAFLFMGIVVFMYFRIPIPSLAVILAAFSDIIITIAIVNIIGMKLSTAGIAAFLMLIGYSVDTDILLSTRVLKRREGTVYDRTIDAMKTGVLMSVTTIVAVSVGLFFAESDVLAQIMTIILIGLFIDLINTWIQNAGILRLYLEKKHGKT